jgi:hypothetical protein
VISAVAHKREAAQSIVEPSQERAQPGASFVDSDQVGRREEETERTIGRQFELTGERAKELAGRVVGGPHRVAVQIDRHDAARTPDR